MEQPIPQDTNTLLQGEGSNSSIDPPTVTHEPPFEGDNSIPKDEDLSSFEGENKHANDDSDVQSEFEEVNA